MRTGKREKSKKVLKNPGKNDHHVNSLNGQTVPQYRDAGWKWSGHTHVYGGTIPSDGDLKILKLFNQNQSAIYDYRGERGMVFNDEAKMD